MWSTSQSEESVKGSPQMAHLKPYRAATRFCMSGVTLLRMLDVFIGGVGLGADRALRSDAGMETASAMSGSSPSSLLLKFAPPPRLSSDAEPIQCSSSHRQLQQP